MDEESKLTYSILESSLMDQYAMVVSRLTKIVGNLQIVNRVNFTVKNGLTIHILFLLHFHSIRTTNHSFLGECFGLLGLNDSGKSTAFNCMTYQELISDGEIYLRDVKITKDPNNYRKLISYCPQKDALLLFMSAFELLKYMALMRGSSVTSLRKNALSLLDGFDLKKSAHKQLLFFSKGDKRKLNVALAMQTDPWLLILDEPTLSVDPDTRREILSSIHEYQKMGKTVLIFSERCDILYYTFSFIYVAYVYSFSECECLCDRVAIMEKGYLVSIGPTEGLKDIFGKGLLVIVMKSKSDYSNHAEVKKMVSEAFKARFRDACEV